MNPQSKTLGTVNELLMAIGAGLITYGVNVTHSQVEIASGLLMAVISLVLMFTRHAGWDLIKSSVRKVISAAGGVAIAFGWMTPEKVAALTAVLAPLLSVVWSVADKTDDSTLPPGVPVLLAFLASLALLPSCSSMSRLEFTPDGCILQKYTDANTGDYKAGFCVGDDGKVNRAVVQWQNAEGQELRLVVAKSKQFVIQYRPAANAPWLSWDEKSGIVIGPFPGQVGPVINGGDVDPADLVPAAPAVPVVE
jgi:hypothetical protein